MRPSLPLLISMALLAEPLSLCAQEPSAQAPLIVDGSLGLGFQLERAAWLSEDDWRRLLPGSSLLQEDLPPRGEAGMYGADFRDSPRGPGSVGGLALATVSASLNLERERDTPGRFDQRLRLGLVYGGGETTRGYWGREETAPYDTLVSLGTGDEYVLDSTWSESYRATLTRSRLGLDAIYIAHRATPSRFSWYVGIGLQAGLATGGNAEVIHNVARWEESPDGMANYEGETLGREQFRIATTGYAGLNALFGIDFRLGKRSPFWSALHLYQETRPGIMLISLPSMPTSATGAWQFMGGLRVDLR